MFIGGKYFLRIDQKTTRTFFENPIGTDSLSKLSHRAARGPDDYLVLPALGSAKLTILPPSG